MTTTTRMRRTDQRNPRVQSGSVDALTRPDSTTSAPAVAYNTSTEVATLPHAVGQTAFGNGNFTGYTIADLAKWYVLPSGRIGGVSWYPIGEGADGQAVVVQIVTSPITPPEAPAGPNKADLVIVDVATLPNVGTLFGNAYLPETAAVVVASETVVYVIMEYARGTIFAFYDQFDLYKMTLGADGIATDIEFLGMIGNEVSQISPGSGALYEPHFWSVGQWFCLNGQLYGASNVWYPENGDLPRTARGQRLYRFTGTTEAVVAAASHADALRPKASRQVIFEYPTDIASGGGGSFYFLPIPGNRIWEQGTWPSALPGTAPNVRVRDANFNIVWERSLPVFNVVGTRPYPVGNDMVAAVVGGSNPGAVTRTSQATGDTVTPNYYQLNLAQTRRFDGVFDTEGDPGLHAYPLYYNSLDPTKSLWIDFSLFEGSAITKFALARIRFTEIGATAPVTTEARSSATAIPHAVRMTRL